MTTLQEKITQDWKDAMKARDPKKDVLALIRTDFKNKAINERAEGGGQTEINDSDAVVVLQKMAKQRREAMESYTSGGRQDLFDKEAFELSIIESYLPGQLSDAELEACVVTAIAETGATSAKDLGKVMGAVLKVAKGRADGKKIQNMVTAKLTGN